MNVLLVVPMVNSHVMTALAYLDHGNVMYTIVIVLAVKMKLIVVLLVVPMVNLTVVMDSAYLVATTVMVHLNSVMLAGVLTVQMAQMKA